MQAIKLRQADHFHLIESYHDRANQLHQLVAELNNQNRFARTKLLSLVTNAVFSARTVIT